MISSLAAVSLVELLVGLVCLVIGAVAWGYRDRPVGLAELVEACWEDVDAAAATLVVDTEALVEADPSWLRKLLDHLLWHAVERGGDGVTVGDLDGGRGSTWPSTPRAAPKPAGRGPNWPSWTRSPGNTAGTLGWPRANRGVRGSGSSSGERAGPDER